MATNTPNLKIPKPEGNEYFNRQNFNNILDVIDQNAASKEDVSNIDLSKLATKDELQVVIDDATTHKNENATEHQRLAKEDARLLNLNNNLQREVSYLKLKQEANERIEGGTTFADDMNNHFGIELDEANSENIVIRDGSMLMLKEEIVEHNQGGVSVVDKGYKTNGNGGRKIARLSNGWLVIAVRNVDTIIFYKSTDNGDTWSEYYSVIREAATNSDTSVSLASNGNIVYALIGGYNVSSTEGSSGRGYVVFTLDFNTNAKSYYLLHSSAQVTSVGQSSMVVNDSGTEIHACWSCQTSSYPNNRNIYYAKGTINTDGSVTWGAVEQVTLYNSGGDGNRENPTIITTKNSVSIIAQVNYTNSRAILYLTKEYTTKNFDPSYTNEKWGSTLIYSGASYSNGFPSAIFIPQSINGLDKGRILVTWHGVNSTSQGKNNIFVTHSDDNGVNWSSKQLTNDTTTNNDYPSITADRSGKVYIVYQRPYTIKMFTWFNNVWDDGQQIIRGGTATDVDMFPSTLVDFSLNSVTIPPCIFYDKLTSVYCVTFYGNWTSIGEAQTTTATAIYDLPSTDYVGAFVKKEGNVNIDAYINDVVMDKSLENDEYMFTKDLPSEAPIKLRLELSRDNTNGGNNDKVTRILGGRA